MEYEEGGNVKTAKKLGRSPSSRPVARRRPSRFQSYWRGLKSWFRRRQLGELLSVITGSTTAMVSLGLAWASVGCGFFTPVGIFLILAALVNLVANKIFYQRDTLRIDRWMNPFRARTAWPHVFAKGSKAGVLKKCQCYVAAFFGFAELEAQLRIQHFSQTLCPDRLTQADYQALYARLKALYQDNLPQDPDFVRLWRVASLDDGGVLTHAHCQLVDYALGVGDYQLLMADVELESKISANFVGEGIFAGVYRDFRVRIVSKHPVGDRLLPKTLDVNQLAGRIWLRRYLRYLQKEALNNSNRQLLLAQLVSGKDGKVADPLFWPLLGRKCVTFLFLVLAAMLSVGMSLILMRGLEGFFIKLAVASSTFTPIAGVLVGIAFFCILFQLYVTFNEFWVDAYVYNAGSLADRFKLMGYQLKAWLTGDQLIWNKDQPELMPNTGYRRWHIAKRLITGTLFLGIIAMAIIASIGLYKSFVLSLKTLFTGEKALLLLSPVMYAGITLTLKVAFASRVKMAVILMGRCFWKALSGVVWTGRYITTHCRYAWAHAWGITTRAAALKPEIDAFADSAASIRQNIKLFILVLFNAVINLFWVDSHDFPKPLMWTAAGLQSQMLVGRNALGSFAVPRLKPTRHYYEAFIQPDGMPDARLANKLSDLMRQPSHSALWEAANILAVMYFKGGFTAVPNSQILFPPQTDDAFNRFVASQVKIDDADGRLSYDDFNRVVEVLYTEMAYNALPKLRLPFTWDWLRRLWEMGLTKWLSRGVGAGGALWFGYVIVSHMGWLPELTPLAAMAVPAVVLALSIALATYVVYDYLQAHTDQAGRDKRPPSDIESSKLKSFLLKTMGSAGIAWSIVSAVAACGASVPFLGLGLALTAFTFGAFLWCFEKELPNTYHLWFEVGGAGAAVWFMGRAAVVMLQATAGITLGATFHYVLVGVAATMMARALVQWAWSKWDAKPVQQDEKLIQAHELPDHAVETENDLKASVLNTLWSPSLFTRARWQIEKTPCDLSVKAGHDGLAV